MTSRPPPPRLSPVSRPSQLAANLRLLGLALVLIPLLARAMSLLSMLPGWDLDPLIMPMPFSGVGPGESILLDCVVLIGAAVMAIFAQRSATRADWVAVTLLAIGAAGVLAHMANWSGIAGAGGLGDRRIGISWLSAMLGGCALWLCRRDQSLSRIAAAVLLGFVGMLAAKAAQQILIEHPATVSQYRADPARFLAGQGLLPDTPMARAFERRLLQPEATGWFGLSNVFATIMAGTAVSLVGMLSLGMKQRASLRAAHLAIVVATVIASLGALVATGSKGGALAAMVGGAALFVAAASAKLKLPERTLRIAGTAFGLAAVTGPIALIVVRGLIGERMSELSLLFRWFYMQGAARIFAAHPMGVGPDGFQQAYLLAKPPISPEEVTSPHSITLDWLADLGVLGFAWVALLLIVAVSIGRVLTAAAATSTVTPTPATDAHTHAPGAHAESRLILLIPGLATLLAAWLERDTVTPDGAVVRLLGLIAWCAAAWGVLNIARAVAAWPIAMAAGATAILAHSQIDVAATWAQSVGLVAVWLAIAASMTSTNAQADRQASRGINPGLLLGIVAIAAIVLSRPLSAWQWQAGLLSAKDHLADVADLNARLAAAADGSSREDMARIAADVAAAISQRQPGEHAAPRNSEELRTSMARLEILALSRAAAQLAEAATIEPAEWRVRREASRLLLRVASAAEALNDRAAAIELADEAIDVMSLPLPEAPGEAQGVTAPEWRWLAIANLEARRLAELPMYGSAAAAALRRAAALDPYNLEIALRLMRVYVQLGDSAAAADWAGKVLELDPLMRLDPAARGLTESEREEARQALPRP